jgi:hypothetical protein
VLHLSCCAWNADNDREPGELMGGYRADDVYELLARGDRRRFVDSKDGRRTAAHSCLLSALTCCGRRHTSRFAGRNF